MLKFWSLEEILLQRFLCIRLLIFLLLLLLYSLSSLQSLFSILPQRQDRECFGLDLELCFFLLRFLQCFNCNLKHCLSNSSFKILFFEPPSIKSKVKRKNCGSELFFHEASKFGKHGPLASMKATPFDASNCQGIRVGDKAVN